MVRSPLLATALVALALASPVRAGAFDDLKAKLDAQMTAPGENVFPEPQDQALTRIKLEADQVLWLFRQARASAHRKATQGGIDSLLADALTQKHQFHAWVLTKRLRREHEAGGAEHWERFARALAEPPQPEDLAAFVSVLERLPDALRGQLGAREAAARAAAGALDDPTRLADYVARCEAAPEFYKKRSWLGRQGRKAAKGLGGLLDRLELRFSKENLIRFFARLARGSRFDKVRERSRDAREALVRGLSDAVAADLEDQLEGGLGERVQAIELVAGGIRTKTALTRGRLRVVMKLMDALKDQPQDVRLFLPALEDAHRFVKQRRRDAAGDAAAYLKRLDETLDFAVLVHRRRAQQPDTPAPEQPILDAIWKTLKAEDFEGLFAELASDPDLI